MRVNGDTWTLKSSIDILLLHGWSLGDCFIIASYHVAAERSSTSGLSIRPRDGEGYHVPVTCVSRLVRL